MASDISERQMAWLRAFRIRKAAGVCVHCGGEVPESKTKQQQLACKPCWDAVRQRAKRRARRGANHKRDA